MSVKLFTLKKKNHRGGFVILYAVIITTVVLLVGVSLMNIMTKQLVLSSISRNAKVSYYAALAGRDCAEFWKKIQIDGTDYFSEDHSATPITCFENPVTGYKVGTEEVSELSALVTTFNLELTVGTTNVCSVVSIVSSKDDPCAANRLLISSAGYNTSCDKIEDSSNPRLVRSIYKDKEVVCQ